MTAVLGIDAAWTTTNPSGVALAVRDSGGWRLLRTNASYGRFLAHEFDLRPRGGAAPVDTLLERAREIAGQDVDLVAVDMPLSREPITGRRVSDNAVSSAFGAMKCATHSPSAARPGQLADTMRGDFAAQGYDLLTHGPAPARGLIEVYPHPALVRLCGEAERLRYKHSKMRNYWPALDRAGRLTALRAVWAQIVTALDQVLVGASDALQPPSEGAPTWEMKAFEDRLDAVVCAWVGVCVLEGRAEAFGDDVSAIWVPVA